MSNPINPLSRSSAGSVNSNAEKPQNNVSAKGAPDSGTSSISSQDTVSLSQKSQQVSGLQQQLNSSPAIDQAKVDSIKQEIANGNYPLDAEKIAENLINLERSLLE
ncbi:hypothetical protein MNBD_GAMMA08-734 [hydrothermal vent metagenome]|uniref:Negative regulator of flagellin synthesis n=1 Tax=hydrothermal vent metagenome TaxID=652676 RepID=A0A3B0XK09_9ZZZZ